MYTISEKNVCDKIMNSSKIRQAQKILISTFAQFFAAMANVSFLCSRLCLEPI